jgi:Family of unknown function (DUF6247)
VINCVEANVVDRSFPLRARAAGDAHVTALGSCDDQPRYGDPLLPGAAPAAIREALLPEGRAEFDSAYEPARRGAAEIEARFEM